MAHGYMGRILMVDLQEGTCLEEVIPDKVYENYLSVTGLAAHILFDRISASMPALLAAWHFPLPEKMAFIPITIFGTQNSASPVNSA